MAQSYQNFELIIIDDGSTDETAQILKQYENDPKVTIHTKTNRGLSSARNTGITLAKGQYLAFLDSDDLWNANKLEKQVRLFNKEPSLGIVYTDCDYIDSYGNILPNEKDYYHADPEIKGKVYEKLISKNQICGSGSAVLIPKTVFSEVGLFDENLKSCEDQDMWLRISKKYSVDYVNERLVKIRVHSEGMQKNTNRMFLYSFIVLARQLDISNYNDKVLSEIEKALNSQLTWGRWKLLTENLDTFPEIRSHLNRNAPTVFAHIFCSLLNRIGRKIINLVRKFS